MSYDNWLTTNLEWENDYDEEEEGIDVPEEDYESMEESKFQQIIRQITQRTRVLDGTYKG